MYPLQQGLRGLVVPPKATAGAAGIGKTMWRLFIPSTASAAAQIRDLEFWDASGNLVVEAEVYIRVFATSRLGASYGPDSGFVGSTGWIPATATNEYIGWRFDAAVEIIEAHWKNASSTSRGFTTGRFEYSEDGGATWVLAWEDTSIATTANAANSSTKP